MNNYHSIKFILDIAYDDHTKLNDPNWEQWLKSINKIFKNDIPISLLLGLQNKNNIELSKFVDLNIDKYNKCIERRDAANKKVQDKYNKWIERRDAGNKIAQYKREKLKNEKELLKKKNDEEYCNKMQPIWDIKLQELINSRTTSHYTQPS